MMNLRKNCSTIATRPTGLTPIPLQWMEASPITVAVRQEPALGSAERWPSPEADFASQLTLASSIPIRDRLVHQDRTVWRHCEEVLLDPARSADETNSASAASNAAMAHGQRAAL
jgi:hypothetical protein